jgi:hypothetical protein
MPFEGIKISARNGISIKIQEVDMPARWAFGIYELKGS